jgi:hypothetical protein
LAVADISVAAAPAISAAVDILVAGMEAVEATAIDKKFAKINCKRSCQGSKPQEL